MKTQLFKVEAKLPAHIKEVSLYRTTPFSSFKRSDRKFMDYMQDRIEACRGMFPFDAQLKDNGDMYVMKSEQEVLEIYLSSDSFWYSERNWPDKVDPAQAQDLPDEQKVRLLADEALEKFNLKTENLRFSGIDRNKVSIFTSPKDPGKTFSTRLSANYEFELGGLPIIGPGAKVSITFAQKERMVDFLYFYRQAWKAQTIPVISPEDAIKIFMGDSRFMELDPKDGAHGVITNIDFGYYALGPHEVQRIYFPVYKIQAKLATKALPEQELELYVIGSRTTPSESKKMNVTGRPVYFKTFS